MEFSIIMKHFKIGGVKLFFHRLLLSARLMSKTERILLYILIGLISFEVAFKGYGLYLNNTTSIPKSGGVYKEISVGEVKYVNPIFAKTDAERSVSRLIYGSLVRLDEKGEIAPDLAEKWEVSSDGLTYRFYLKEGVTFHDGEQLTAADVVNTFNAIKNPDIKSPYQSTWANVDVSSPEAGIVELKIPRQYGPFIFNCTQGIVASNNLQNSLAETVNGTGPYRLKNLKTMKEGYTFVDLEAFNNYSNQPVLIPRVELSIYPDALPDTVKNNLSDYSAVAGASVDSDNFINQSFKVGRALMLIPNLKNTILADAANRAKLFKYERFADSTKFRLIALDAPSQKSTIDDLKEKLKDANVTLDVQLLSAVDFYKKAQARDFDLILYGADFGPDRDPYTFWHSSQIGKNNFASYSEKSMDIKLEDARMILDANDRNAKYDEIYKILTDQNLVLFYPQVKYQFEVNKNLQGVDTIIGNRPEDRFNTISNWYLQEERIRKRS